MPTMVLTKACKVSGARQQPGHRFDVPEKEARLYMALGRAKEVGEAKSLQASQPQPDAAQAPSERRQGRYNRRDMRAED